MEQILRSICGFERYSSLGKKKLVNYIKQWSDENLKNFRVGTQTNFLALNKWELSRICALMLNLIFITYISTTNNLLNYFGTIISIIILYITTFKTVFLFLTLITPSQNITLSKNSNNKNIDKNIIICAHYDTKNAFTKSKKGMIKSLLKENIYSISRILASYISKFEKYMYALTFAFYIFYTATVRSTSEVFNIIDDGPNLVSFGIQITVEVLLYSLLCALITYILSYPYIKKMNSNGADDNGSGVCAALELAHQLDKVDINANLKIVLFDNEERGLIGSNHFMSKYSKELRKQNTKVINLDCVGRGKDIYITTDRRESNLIVKHISETMRDMEMSFELCNIDYSDHKPFELAGLDAVTIGRYNTKKYLWYRKFPVIDWIHGSEDEIGDVDINKISQVVKIVKNTIVKNYVIK